MSKLVKSISFISIGVILLYLAPLFFNLPNWEIEYVFPEVLYDPDYQDSLLRTISFAVISTVAVIMLSFLLGYILRNIKSNKSLKGNVSPLRLCYICPLNFIKFESNKATS